VVQFQQLARQQRRQFNMNTITESLKANDLRHFVNKVFTIDSFKSKIGDDVDVLVLCFEVDDEDPAKDLENFIEMGYDFVLDADVSPGETDDGNYKVFVELERGRHAAEQVREILDGVGKLAGIDNFRFRYFKSFKSQEATKENLLAAIPTSKEAYEEVTKRFQMDNFSNFFSNSYSDSIKVANESITFQRTYSGPITFDIVNSGSKNDIYKSIKGPIILESKDMAEVMFLTKVIGNYNITKIGNTFVFENKHWAVALTRKLYE
jgi:hypothetical protein